MTEKTVKVSEIQEIVNEWDEGLSTIGDVVRELKDLLKPDPADAKPGEAWVIRTKFTLREFNAIKTESAKFQWVVYDPNAKTEGGQNAFSNEAIVLVSPLVPEVKQ